LTRPAISSQTKGGTPDSSRPGITPGLFLSVSKSDRQGREADCAYDRNYGRYHHAFHLTHDTLYLAAARVAEPTPQLFISKSLRDDLK
jgi:hypothetical protein